MHGLVVGTGPVRVPGTGRTGPVPTGFANPGRHRQGSRQCDPRRTLQPIQISDTIWSVDSWQAIYIVVSVHAELTGLGKMEVKNWNGEVHGQNFFFKTCKTRFSLREESFTKRGT
jgi:hypothetical protein